MKVIDKKLTVRLDLELSAEQIAWFFCIHYNEDAEHLREIATRLNKTEILNIVKNTMSHNMFTGINHKYERDELVIDIMRRKFDGIL